MCQFNLAVNTGEKDDQGNYISEFHPCTVWNGAAEYLAKYAIKGDLIEVEGRLRSGSYEKNGQKVYFTDVQANNVSLLSYKKKEQQSQQPQQQYQQFQPAYQQQLDTSRDSQFVVDTDDLPFF